MRIGIYNHQHLRGGCPVCSQTYVKGMIADGMKCMNRAKGIYGEDNEFVNYTDLGDYPSDNLERPGFKRMMGLLNPVSPSVPISLPVQNSF